MSKKVIILSTFVTMCLGRPMGRPQESMPQILDNKQPADQPQRSVPQSSQLLEHLKDSFQGTLDTAIQQYQLLNDAGIELGKTAVQSLQTQIFDALNTEQFLLNDIIRAPKTILNAWKPAPNIIGLSSAVNQIEGGVNQILANPLQILNPLINKEEVPNYLIGFTQMLTNMATAPINAANMAGMAAGNMAKIVLSSMNGSSTL